MSGLTLPTFWDTSYDQPRTSDTVTYDLVSNRQEVTSDGPDQWTGWFKGIAETLVNYGIAKDMAQTTMQANQPVYQPVTYSQPVAQQGINGGTVLLLGGALLVGMFLAGRE